MRPFSFSEETQLIICLVQKKRDGLTWVLLRDAYSAQQPSAFSYPVYNVPDSCLSCERGGSVFCFPFVYLFIILFSTSAKLDIGIELQKRTHNRITDNCDLVTRQ